MPNNWNVQAALALGIALSFVALVTVWMLHPPQGDEAHLSLLNALVMVVGTAFLTVVNWYFGSSAGSKDKDQSQHELLDRMAAHIAKEQTNDGRP